MYYARGERVSKVKPTNQFPTHRPFVLYKRLAPNQSSFTLLREYLYSFASFSHTVKPEYLKDCLPFIIADIDLPTMVQA